MADDRYTLRDLVVEHPIVDQAPAVVAGAGWYFLFRDWDPENVSEFLVGLATVSALVLTAATFVCTLTYQSTTPRVVAIRTAYGPQIRRNWTSIFLLSFLASVAPLAAILFLGSGPVTPLLAIWAAAMLMTKSARTLYWLKTMLFMQYIEDQAPAELRPMRDRGAGAA